MWRAKRVNPERSGVYRFGESVLMYDEYKVSGSKGSYGVQIWMHDRPGNRVVLQIRNGTQPGRAELSLVDVDARHAGAADALDLMWQQDAPGGLHETLARLSALAYQP